MFGLPMTCQVCDKPGGESIRGFTMHPGCAPGYWLKDRDDLAEFMVKFRAWWETPAADRWKNPRRKR